MTDDLHSHATAEKMRSGILLDDADRKPGWKLFAPLFARASIKATAPCSSALL